MAPSYYRLLEGSTLFVEPKSETQQVAIRFERFGDITKVDDIKITFTEITARRGSAPIRDNRGPGDIARGFPATYYQSGSEATGGDYHNYLLDSKTGLEKEYSHIRLLPGQSTDGIAFYLLPDGIKDGTKEFQIRIEALDPGNNTIQSLYQTVKILDADESAEQATSVSIFTIDPITFVNEGERANITIRRTGNLSDSHYIRLGESWRSSQLPAKIGLDFSGDFVGRELTILPNQSEISFQVSTIDDAIYEDLRSVNWNGRGEWFDVITSISNGLRNSTPFKWENLPGYDSPEGQTRIFINDNDQPALLTYTLTPSASSINEGSTLTTSVATTDVASGTTLYYSLSGTGINSSDFSSGALTGSGTVSSSGSFSFSHILANDLTTEGTETLNIKLFSDSSRSTQVGSTASVSIADTSVPALPTFSVSTTASTINEGDGFTTTLTTTGVAAGTTYYWVRSGSGITSTDFIFGGLSGSASIGSDGKFSYTHLTENDLITEGDETVGFRVFSDSNRSQQVGSTVSILIRDTSITPAVSGVTVNGNNSGIANSGTITNNGTINTGTQTTNSNNTTTNTNNTTNNNINNFFTYYTNTTNNTNSNNTVTNTNSNNTISTWNIYRVDNSVKAGDIVNQWFGTATPSSTQLQDISETKLMDVVASTWADKVQINRVVKASDTGGKIEAKQIEVGSGEVAGSVVSGGKGSDDIKGFAGWDNLEGGDGNDLIHGGNGRDIISGGAGRDELHGDFGWNTYKSEKDGVSDLIAVKSDHYLVNWLYGKAGNSPNGEKADIIEGLDSIDKIKLIGIDTREITFAANISAKGVTGIGIYGKGILEALYTGGDLTVAQITQMTSGDASAAAMSNSVNAYGVW